MINRRVGASSRKSQRLLRAERDEAARVLRARAEEHRQLAPLHDGHGAPWHTEKAAALEAEADQLAPRPTWWQEQWRTWVVVGAGVVLLRLALLG